MPQPDYDTIEPPPAPPPPPPPPRVPPTLADNPLEQDVQYATGTTRPQSSAIILPFAPPASVAMAAPHPSAGQADKYGQPAPPGYELVPGGGMRATGEKLTPAAEPTKPSVEDRIIRAEGTAHNPMSSAAGIGQFIDSTWLSITAGEPETRGKSKEQILSMKTDPTFADFNRRMVHKYRIENQNSLEQAGLPATGGNLYLAHFLGAGGASKVLTASASTPVRDILDPAAVAANPQIAGMTAGELVNHMESLVEGRGGDPSTLQSWLLSQAQDDTAKATEAMNESRSLGNEWLRKATAAVPGSKERLAAMDKAIALFGEANDHYKKITDTPPVYKPADMWEQWGSPMMLIAGLGGLMSRQHATAALNAAGAAMMAMNQGRWDQYQVHHQQWKEMAEAASNHAKMIMEEINLLASREKLSYDERQAGLDVIKTRYGMSKDQMDYWSNHADRMTKILEQEQARRDRLDMMKALQGPKAEEQNIKIQNYHNAVAAKQEQYLQEHPDQDTIPASEKSKMETEAAAETGIVSAATAKLSLDPKIAAFRQFRQEHPSATSQELMGFLRQQYSSRSPMGQILQKYNEAFPNASSEDLVKVYAGAQQTLSASRYFASGRGELVLRSFNAIADHIDAYKDIAAAFGTGDVRLINEAKARFQLQTGFAAPNNLEMVKTVLGDEIARAIIGGVGALADREAVQAPLSRANSPEQIAGVVSTVKRLVGGQFVALKQTYDSTGMAAVQPFESRLTPAAKQLFAEKLGPEHTGQGVSGSLPPGIPEGSTPVGKTQDGHTVYKTPDGKQVVAE